MQESELQPDKADLSLRQEAIELVKAGQSSVAEPLLRAYLNRYPHDAQALAWLAACQPVQEALETLDQLLKVEPEAYYLEAWRTAYARQISPSSPPPETKTEITQPDAVDYPLAPETVSVVANPTEAADSSSDGIGLERETLAGEAPVSLSELIPGFEALPDAAVIIPPPPPPAPPQVEPLPRLDPTEWLARATSEARRLPELTPEISERLAAFIARLNQLQWPDNAPGQDEAAQRARYNRGIELARSGEGNPARLDEAVKVFQQCPPALGYAGLAETLVSASYVREGLYHPVGLVYAVFWADRALGLDPFSLDALIARSEATVRSEWRLLADVTLGRLRLLAPEHPRHYAAEAWYELLHGDRRRATELFQLAHDKAITPAERERYARMLEPVAGEQ